VPPNPDAVLEDEDGLDENEGPDENDGVEVRYLKFGKLREKKELILKKKKRKRKRKKKSLVERYAILKCSLA
jgi:hypothetical protein